MQFLAAKGKAPNRLISNASAAFVLAKYRYATGVVLDVFNN